MVRFALATLTACGGTDTPTDPVDLDPCDEMTTAPLPSVPSDEWPAGLSDAIVNFRDVAGTWRTDQCGDDDDWVQLKITVPPEEEIQIITGGVDPAAPCGCTSDPDYGSDYEMDPIATVPVEVYVSDYTDPAINVKTFTLDLVFYGEGQPLDLRACAQDPIDPALGTPWSDATVLFRIDGVGALSGTLAVSNTDRDFEACHLGNWEKQF